MLYAEAPGRSRLARAILFAGWFAIALFMVVRHALWRDEVRALSIALAGDSIPAMLRVLHGEGHPALWYLMLRGAHALLPVRQVLPAVGFAVAAASAALFAFRAPFRPFVIALTLSSAFMLDEYAALARNYGIAMLMLFVLAIVYERWRDRGIAVGLVLALLCNTNVPAALLAASFLLFRLVELVSEEGLKWGPKYRLFLINAAIAACGALICFVTVFPTVHDAAPIDLTGRLGIGSLARDVLHPASSFRELLPKAMREQHVALALLDVAIWGSLLGLLRRPAAFLSGAAALVGFEAFFQLVYPGFYRHQCLLLVYLLTLHWLAAEGCGGRWGLAWADGVSVRRAAAFGQAMFLLLLLFQLVNAVGKVAAEVEGVPKSRSRDLALVLKQDHLTNAVVIADPDMVLEALPYYARNPIYFMREQRFGHVVRFTRRVRTELSLDDYLDDGRALRARTGLPVVIVLRQRIDPSSPPFRIHEAMTWSFSGTRAQIGRFLGATQRLARFAPAVSDESYDVYLLK
ncbi:MAG TPA: hypothetical protein VFW19_07870 [Allosphingosinicella sp.]|nr:hypothetical protein [Allosphingosinicella sp.]